MTAQAVKHWQLKEHLFLVRNYDRLTTGEIARQLGRTYKAVNMYTYKRGINKQPIKGKTFPSLLNFM